jgi:protein-S-isoprenylcysteine O-methyltransferase Ste14
MGDNMTIKLFIQAITKFFSGIILLGLLIFLPAGTLNYFGGWLLMGILFVPMLLAGIVMIFKSPALLEKRLNAKEKQAKQSLVVKLSGLMFLAGFIVAGLDYRFGWFPLPKAVSIVAAVVFLLGYILYAIVLKQNAYLSRTIEIQENQKVIDTGLYSVVRHPMYSATLIMFLAMPIILGSLYSFLIFLFYPFIIAKRIKGEEEFLEENLEGYTEYKQKVKYRLIPFIW